MQDQVIEFAEFIGATKTRQPACGNSDCKISSGIHSCPEQSDPGLTFGSGKLNDLGYWDKPCTPCARAYEKEHPEVGECWPFQNTD